MINSVLLIHNFEQNLPWGKGLRKSASDAQLKREAQSAVSWPAFLARRAGL